MSVFCPLETWSLVCSFLNDKFYFSPCITSSHFIWALCFLFLNKNGINIGAWRAWIIHTCLYLVHYFKRGIMGLGASLELWKGVGLSVSQTPKPQEDCLGRHDPNSIWGPKLIYCQIYNLLPSRTVLFIDVVEEISADIFLNWPILEIPIPWILLLGLRDWEITDLRKVPHATWSGAWARFLF